jgi:hypothetical protein
MGMLGKIDRSAEALRVSHHLFIFPSNGSFTTRLAGDGAGKTVEIGIQRYSSFEIWEKSGYLFMLLDLRTLDHQISIRVSKY